METPRHRAGCEGSDDKASVCGKGGDISKVFGAENLRDISEGCGGPGRVLGTGEHQGEGC